MLKGLKGILEKGLQIAAPMIGGSMFGPTGAAFGSGIASLLTGNKVQDAIASAGIGYLGSEAGILPNRGGVQSGKSFTRPSFIRSLIRSLEDLFFMNNLIQLPIYQD